MSTEERKLNLLNGIPFCHISQPDGPYYYFEQDQDDFSHYRLKAVGSDQFSFMWIKKIVGDEVYISSLRDRKTGISLLSEMLFKNELQKGGME